MKQNIAIIKSNLLKENPIKIEENFNNINLKSPIL